MNRSQAVALAIAVLKMAKPLHEHDTL